jgi:RepB DNA-primase from phage plasmid
MTPSTNSKMAIALLLPANQDNKRVMQHHWIDGGLGEAMSNMDLLTKIIQANESGADVYFSTARFQGELGLYAGRTKANVVSCSSFFIDIDNKDQPNKTELESQQELIRLCSSDYMPIPSQVVRTGNGLHAYWNLASPITPALWQSTADALKRVTQSLAIRCDHACTSDIARVLRLPGFVNTKGGKTAEVVPGFSNTLYDIEDLRASLGALPVPTAAPTASAFSGVADQLTTRKVFPIASWDKLKANIQAGECQVLARAAQEQAGVRYNLWAAQLSIANYTDQPTEAVTFMCGQHPDFDLDKSLQKAATFDGPRTCAALADSATESGYGDSPCAGCKHKDKISSPISLSRAVVEQPTTVATTTLTGEELTTELLGLPSPYRRGKPRQGSPKGGGVMLVISGTDEAGEYRETEELVMREDIRLIGVSEMGETPGTEQVTYKFEYLHPKQGFRRIVISASDLSSSKGDTLTAALANALVDLSDATPQWRLRVSKFLQSLVTAHSDSQNITQTVTKFGPQDDTDDGFVLGQWSYKKDGTREQVILAEPVQLLSEHMPSPPRTVEEGEVRKSLIKEWNQQLKEVLPHDTLHAVDQFVLCSGFATALAPYITPSRVRGGMIVVNYNGSGSGKSSMVERATHIYTGGDAKFVTPDGTHMSFLETRVQVGNALPMSFDEMCKEDEKGAQQLYNMALCSSNRKQRERLMSKSRGTWNTWIYATMNPDPHSLLSSRGLAADGALHRVLSIKTDPARFGTGAELLSAQGRAHKLERWGQKHGGHVGTAWIEYIMPKLDNLTARYEHWQSRFQKEMPEVFRGSGERFAVAICVTTMVAAEAAREAGLHPFNVEGIFAYAQMALKRSLNIISDNTINDAELFSELVSSSLEVTLIKSDTAFGLSDRLPTRRIGVRVETEGGKATSIMITKPYIKEWALKNRIDAGRVLNAIKAMPGTSIGRVTLTKGTSLPTLQANCIVMDSSGLEVLANLDKFPTLALETTGE